MAEVCKECEGGVFECGEEGQLCGAAGEPWKEAGIAYVPIGVGNLTARIRVCTKVVEVPNEAGDGLEPRALVKLIPACPPPCDAYGGCDEGAQNGG
jgi:hypothetical protein